MKKYKTLIIIIAVGIVLTIAMVLIARRKGILFFDDRSERVLNSLEPELREKTRRILAKAQKEGYDVRAISGERTCEEQNRLYAQGRTTSGNIVTNAKCGFSLHNYRKAVDLGFFKDGKYWQDAPYHLIGEWGKAEGLEWGGDWKTLNDPPHLQLPNQNINELYKKYQETGKLLTV